MKGCERRQGMAARRHRSRSRSRDRSSREGNSPHSRGTDTEDGEVKEPSSPMRAGPLSARQQARVADLSLLLDVILKTNYYKCVTSPLSSALIYSYMCRPCTRTKYSTVCVCKEIVMPVHTCADAVLLKAQGAADLMHCACPKQGYASAPGTSDPTWPCPNPVPTLPQPCISRFAAGPVDACKVHVGSPASVTHCICTCKHTPSLYSTAVLFVLSSRCCCRFT